MECKNLQEAQSRNTKRKAYHEHCHISILNLLGLLQQLCPKHAASPASARHISIISPSPFYVASNKDQTRGPCCPSDTSSETQGTTLVAFKAMLVMSEVVGKHQRKDI